jgi:uncharacterized RDD family membrane protein YckC
MNKNINNKPFIFRKIIATIVDYALLFTVTYLYMSEFGEPNSAGGYTVHGFYAIPPILMWFLILPFTETVFSQTFGHFLVGLKVIDITGDKPSIFQSVKRRVADMLDIFFFGIPAFIAINKSEYNQRLGDLWAETYVIRNN